MKKLFGAFALAAVFASSAHAEIKESTKAVLELKNSPAACYECVSNNESAFEGVLLICAPGINKTDPWPGIENCAEAEWDLAQKLCGNVCIPQEKK